VEILHFEQDATIAPIGYDFCPCLLFLFAPPCVAGKLQLALEEKGLMVY
jgi:hypothetical protein